MDADDVLKYEALKRIISGAKELGYDVLTYEKELSELLELHPDIADIISEKENDKKLQNEVDTDLKQSTDIVVYAADIANVTQTTDFEQKKESVIAANLLDDLPKLMKIKKDNNSVIFLFNRELKDNETKFLQLKGESIRYIYDIKGIKTNDVNDINIKNIKDLRISQFDKETVRVVFEHTKQMNITKIIKGEELIFSAKEFTSDSTVKDNKTISVPSDKTNVKAVVSQKTIVIDAGHGGKDGGAVADKKLEKNVVLQIALLLGAELEKRGHKVFYTRDKDVYLKLHDRTKTANDKNADIFISIHANAAPKNGKNRKWQGIETFFLSPSDSERSKNAAELENQSDIEEMNRYSRQTFLNFLNREKIIASHKLAIDIQQYILTEVKKSYKDVVDGGVREAPFWVLTGAQMPAVLLEVGYITDKTDRERMFSKKFQQVLIEGIANGIEFYFVKNM
jgi:N-acetylmuramoyl-L-alanine amidase